LTVRGRQQRRRAFLLAGLQVVVLALQASAQGVPLEQGGLHVMEVGAGRVTIIVLHGGPGYSHHYLRPEWDILGPHAIRTGLLRWSSVELPFGQSRIGKTTMHLQSRERTNHVMSFPRRTRTLGGAGNGPPRLSRCDRLLDAGAPGFDGGRPAPTADMGLSHESA
jgi:hypothetical protein